MRRSLYTALLFSMLIGLSIQQSDCPFSRTVASAADYNAIKDCKSLLSLTLQTTDLEEISFPSLETISGSLIIGGCTITKKIDLPVLTMVDGDLQIIQNPVLETINIPTPTAVTNQLVITDNGNLNSMIVAVSTCTDVIIEDNHLLNATNGATWNVSLPALTTCSSLSIFNNTGLVSAEIPKLSKTNADFRLAENPNLVSFSAPTALAVTGGALISSNPYLSDFTFNPTTVAGSLTFDTNGLNAANTWNVKMDSLTSCDILEIKNNYHLGSFSMAKLSKVSYGLAISNNPNFVSVSAPGPFPIGQDLLISSNQGSNWDLILGASFVGGQVSITLNTGINKLSLDKLENIGADMVVTTNTINVISANSKFPVKGSVSINDNSGLTNMDLDGLYSCDVGLAFINNKGNNFPISLNGLAYVKENLDFNSNPGLAYISLQGLKVIGSSFSSSTGADTGSLSIFDNNLLARIAANSTEFTIRSEVTITNNPLLKVIDMSGLVRVGGLITISKNGLNTINLSGMKCAGSMTLADNAGIQTITMTSLTQVGDSILFSPAVVSNCNMCVGSGSSDCARCGACLSCAGNTTCGSDNANWKDLCTADTSSCPVIELPVITVTQPSDVPTDVPSDYTNSFTNTRSTSTSSSGAGTNTNVATNTISNEEEGAADSMKVCGALLAVALVGSALL